MDGRLTERINVDKCLRFLFLYLEAKDLPAVNWYDNRHTRVLETRQWNIWKFLKRNQ